jgi:RNA polymerase sigma-70 factor (ECF subfamily)
MSMTRQHERTLLARAARGDRDAAAECIRAHQGPVYAYILRMCGRPEVAEDVVQEAFVRVLSNLDRYDPRFRFSTWLFTIARRVYLNTQQRKRAYPSTDLVAFLRDDAESPAERLDERAFVGSNHDRAMRQLTEVQREVLVLFHQLDWPIALIAQHLELPQGTVKSHLHRARQRLRVLLTETRRPDHIQERKP